MVPNTVKEDITASFLCVPFRTTIFAHLAHIPFKANSASYLEMDDTLLPAPSRSMSPGPILSETGSSVQVHADIVSTSVTGTDRSATPSVQASTRMTVDPFRERLSRTRLPSPFVSSHGSETPPRDDLLRDLIASHETLLFGTASVPLSHSLKRLHDGEPTDTEPLAKRDRLIEELDLMVSSGSKGATASLQTRQKEIDEHDPSVTSSFHAEETRHARIILPIRPSSKSQTNEQQSEHSTTPLELLTHMEKSSEEEDTWNPLA